MNWLVLEILLMHHKINKVRQTFLGPWSFHDQCWCKQLIYSTRQKELKSLHICVSTEQLKRKIQNNSCNDQGWGLSLKILITGMLISETLLELILSVQLTSLMHYMVGLIFNWFLWLYLHWFNLSARTRHSWGSSLYLLNHHYNSWKMMYAVFRRQCRRETLKAFTANFNTFSQSHQRDVLKRH